MPSENFKKMKQRNLYSIPELPEKKKKVLLFFANKGEANAYEVSDACKLQYSTAHSSVKALEKEGALRFRSEEINQKGVVAKTYEITTEGVHRCLCADLLWHEKVEIVEKQQNLLMPNVSEWMKFIESLNDQNTEEMVSSNIGGILKVCKDQGYFIDCLDDSFFDAILVTMISFDETYTKAMSVIGSFPRLKEKLLKLIEDDIVWRQEDCKKYIRIKAEIEKLYCKK